MEAKRPFSTLDWITTPEPVKKYIVMLENHILQLQRQQQMLEQRLDRLEQRVNKNSQNSSQPPSSDGPFQKPARKRKKSKRKRGGQKGHAGHRQKMLAPGKVNDLFPQICGCGHMLTDRKNCVPYYTHQHIELPEIKMQVTHFRLHKGLCPCCGKTLRAELPGPFQSGYGPRLSATIAELSGPHGMSRYAVQGFCRSVLGFSISTGGIQQVIDRCSAATKPIYAKIAAVARTAAVNGIDETPWHKAGKLNWLWNMVNDKVAFFMIHPNRSKKAFEQLIADWRGILVSDNYGVYAKWAHKRQTCLAHLIRKAKALAGQKDETTRCFGKNILKELRLLCHWAKAPPSEKQWTDFYSRLMLLLMLHENGDDPAGKLARSIARQLESLWVFLDENGVSATNNGAERALRFAVLWRKRSYGTKSEKGNRWVERILSLKQTCRIKDQAVFPILVEAMEAYFKDRSPNLQWVTADY